MAIPADELMDQFQMDMIYTSFRSIYCIKYFFANLKLKKKYLLGKKQTFLGKKDQLFIIFEKKSVNRPSHGNKDPLGDTELVLIDDSNLIFSDTFVTS